MRMHLPARKSTAAKHGFVRSGVKLVHSGPEFFALLEYMAESAMEEILLQFYIFYDDAAGQGMIHALKKATERGVKVYILADGYKSRSLTPAFYRELKAHNIVFARFEPLFRSRKFYIGRRLHHKLCVVDGTQALAGGINIAGQYMGNSSTPPWLDYALYLDGNAAGDIRDICVEYWKDATGQAIAPLLHKQGQEQHIESLSHCSVRIRRNDWIKARHQVWRTYFEFFNQATDSIVIMCSYFLPGWTFLRLIKKAVGRGVKVQVILTGISDVSLSKHAERYLYRWMLRNGVAIYEYKGSVLHAKIAIRDHKWMTIGSYNVNNISALASIECNVEIRNRPFVSQTEQELLQIAASQCTAITPDNFETTQHVIKQLWQWTCYQIIKVILFLATLYFKRDRSRI